MERNTILAVVLSILVLLCYQTIFPAPKHPELPNNSQTIAANSVGSNSAIPSSTGVNTLQSTTNAVEKTTDFETKTTTTDLSYSNVGGSLHKVDFIGNNPFPLTDILSINGLNNAQYIGQKLGNNTVQLSYNDKWLMKI